MKVFISEIHYDNAGDDVGEAIGIQGVAGTELTGWSIVLYNGAVPYTSNSTFSLSALTIDDEGTGFGEVSISLPKDGLQNGGADGMALVNASGQVVQLLSYEGVFTASAGPATGMTSVDIGVAESGTTSVGSSLQLVGGVWKVSLDDSFGVLNVG